VKPVAEKENLIPIWALKIALKNLSNSLFTQKSLIIFLISNIANRYYKASKAHGVGGLLEPIVAGVGWEALRPFHACNYGEA
jgi:hypothetical protein